MLIGGKALHRQHTAIAARVSLHSHRFHRQKKAIFSRYNRTFSGGAQAANAKPGTRKRMPVQKFAWDPNFRAHLPNFVFIERMQRFNDAPSLDQLLYALHAIVMRLDYI